MSVKFVSIFVLCLVVFSLSLSADSLEQFKNVQLTAQQEGNMYTVSFEAFPDDVTLDQLCGLIVPEDIIEKDLHLRHVPLKEQKLPEKFDWREQNACTPIKSQGSCGSCWAFSGVGIFESAIFIKDGVSLDLSEQDLLNCNTYGYGCNGGWLDCVKYFYYKGIPEESMEPYAGYEKKCNYELERAYKIIDYGSVSSSTSTIKNAIMQYGPVESVVAADTSFQYYSGGVFNHESSKNINHAIILVGWDDTLGEKGCWILRNSWGSRWGEDGYMYIEYGKSKVGRYNYCVSY